MFTEKSYSELSMDVYRIDSKHVDFDPNFKEGKVREIEELDYKILKTQDNTINGMQAMAVAPVINGKVDTSEIVIAYAGTNPKDPLDIMTDAQTVVLGNKILIPKSQQLDMSKHHELDKLGIPKSIEYVEGQVMSAEKFVEEIQVDYPHATITTTGHSLGEYIALYIAAENELRNVGFNGPDPYHILSPEAKQWAKENPGMLINYSNIHDKIGNINGDETGARILVDMNMGNKVKDTLTFHNLSTWEFDKDGHVHINDSYENKEARQLQAEKRMNEKLTELSLLAVKLQKSGGGLSSNEKIYLNSAEALLSIEFISQSMRIGLEHVIQNYQHAITEAEEIWDDGVQLAQTIGISLSYNEILEVLAEEEVTKESVVLTPTTYYQEKITSALEVGENFDLLASEIMTSIEELEKTDKLLARQISEGI